MKGAAMTNELRRYCKSIEIQLNNWLIDWLIDWLAFQVYPWFSKLVFIINMQPLKNKSCDLLGPDVFP